jgi:hypothetical protein
MDQMNANPQQRLMVVRNPDDIEATLLDHCPCLQAGSALIWAARRRPFGFNHLVVATDLASGRPDAILAVHDRTAGDAPFLLLETGLTDAATASMMRRMVGRMLAEIIGRGLPLPVIAARTRMPALCTALHDLSRRVSGSVFHPDPRSNVVTLAAAGIAHRIARAVGEPLRFDSTATAMLWAGARGRRLVSGETAAVPLFVVLDLRAATETALSEAARWLYRSRSAPPRGVGPRGACPRLATRHAPTG